MSSEWIGQLRSIAQQFDRDRESVADLRSLEDIRNRYLSRKSGLLTLQLQNVRNVPQAERAEFGRVPPNAHSAPIPSGPSNHFWAATA